MGQLGAHGLNWEKRGVPPDQMSARHHCLPQYEHPAQYDRNGLYCHGRDGRRPGIVEEATPAAMIKATESGEKAPHDW